jgi:hypothetical protein
MTPGSYSGTYVSSFDGNQVVDIKVEELSDVQAEEEEEEEDPLLVTSPGVEAESEVSSTSVCKSHEHAGLSLISVCMK